MRTIDVTCSVLTTMCHGECKSLTATGSRVSRKGRRKGRGVQLVHEGEGLLARGWGEKGGGQACGHLLWGLVAYLT